MNIKEFFKRDNLDEMQKQTLLKIESCVFCALWVLMLTALALLLCFGLKPSRAAEPDHEDGALTASDASARLSAECALLQRVTFSPCGHEMPRRQRLPAELRVCRRAGTLAGKGIAHGHYGPQQHDDAQRDADDPKKKSFHDM